jgi:hypothetical protein
MKKLTLSALLMASALCLHAQQLYFGVPASILLSKSSYTSQGDCITSHHDVTIKVHQDMMPLASGLDFKLIVTGLLAQPGSVQLVPGGPVQVGDTLDMNFDGLTFLFMVPGTLEYEVRAIGTPDILNQPYYCEPLDSIWTNAFCYNAFVYLPTANIKSCTVQMPTARPDEKAQQALQIAPAPEVGLYQVSLPVPAATDTRLEVLDQTGRLISSTVLGAGAAEGRINLQHQPAGIYLVRLYSRNGNLSGKVIR